MKKLLLKCVFLVLCVLLVVPASANDKEVSKVTPDEIFSTKIITEHKSEFDQVTLALNPDIDYSAVSTDELLDITLNFKALTILLYSYSDTVSGIKAVRSYCKAFDEFLKRDDCAEKALKRLQLINIKEGCHEANLLSAVVQSTQYNNPDNFTLNNINYSVAYQAGNSSNPVKTPKGNGIKVHRPNRQLTDIEKNDWINSYENYGYQLSLLGMPSSTYNCHCYTWAPSSCNQNYWMNDRSKFTDDGSYVQEESPSIGSKVFYYSSNPGYEHSAVVTQTASSVANYTVSSKWGQGALLSHKISNCPYYSLCSGVRFYDTPIRIGVKSFQRYINSHLPSTYLGSSLTVDGGFGPATRTAAIKMLQYWLNTSYGAGLTIDGGFGNMTYNACITVAQGDSGMGVYILQGLLYGNGYNPNGFDGSFGVNGGTGCLNAVKDFQRDNGLTVDGRAGKNTFRELCN